MKRQRSIDAGPAESRGGFTLIELVVVMGLLAVLFGIGVGMLSSLNLGRRAAVGLVQNVIRSAHNTAVARSAPARVRIDTATNTILAQGMQVIGTWHFESATIEGGLGLDGANSGATIVDDGYIGRAVCFTGARKGAVVEIPVQNDPGFDLREGFSLDCALRLDQADGGRALNVGGALGLETSGRGLLRVWMKPATVDKNGLESAGGFVALDAPASVLRVGAWTRVRADYDRRVFRLFVDGVEVAREEEDAPVWRLESALVLGDPRATFAGSLDNLVISAVVDSEEAKLPKGVGFAADAPKLIAFAPGGFLDREVHSAPVLFNLEYEDGTLAPVRVGLYGTVE